VRYRRIHPDEASRLTDVARAESGGAHGTATAASNGTTAPARCPVTGIGQA
jgi:hypothetical protein